MSKNFNKINIFGAYDIRGRYPREINEKVVEEIAPAILRTLNLEKGKKRAIKIIIGRDVRLSSPTLYAAIIETLNSLTTKSRRLKVIPAGIVTTPMIYFLTDKLKADAGIVITASHSPKEYNGIKVVNAEGLPVSGKDIYKNLRKQNKLLTRKRKKDLRICGISRISFISLYVKFLKKFLKVKHPIKVVFDCSNGTVGQGLKELVKNNKLIKAIFINSKQDGNFPAHSPDPLEPDAKTQLVSEVLKTKADLGVIFDADGDRAVFIDNLGKEVNPRNIICFLSPLFKEPYLVDVSLGKETMRWILPKAKFIEEITGRYFIKRTAQKKNIAFSAEISGHYYFKDFHYADSGILAAIFVISRLSLLKAENTSFSNWLGLLPKFYSMKTNLKIKNSENFLYKLENSFSAKSYKAYKKDGITIVGNNIWINVRPSNTEPVVRVQLAGKNEQSFLEGKKILDSIKPC